MQSLSNCFKFDQFGNLMLDLTVTFNTSGAAMMLAELAMEAGLPKGVLNIVHGTHV